jgi:hypothetical protein
MPHLPYLDDVTAQVDENKSNRSVKQIASITQEGDALRIGRVRERKLAERYLRLELQRDKPVKQPGKARARC